MKAISPLLSGTIFILITVVIATLVAGWLTVLSRERSESLENTTGQQLRCEYADLFIEKAYFGCNENCFTGVPFSFNVTLKNGGSVSADFRDANFIFKDGSVVKLKTTPQTIGGGTTKKIVFNDIMIYSEPPIPLIFSDIRPQIDHDTRELWRFDEASGETTEDETEYNNDGYVNGASWVDGKFNAALSFNNESYVNVPKSDSLDIRGNITVEAWIKSRNNSQIDSGILCKGGEDLAYCLVFHDRTINFLIGDSFGNIYKAVSSNIVNDNEWHHIVGVYDYAKVSVYLDGVKSDGDAFDGEIRLNLRNITIGNKENNLGAFVNGFQGSIDELMISNTTRTFIDPTTVTTIDLTYVLSHPNMIKATLYNSAGNIISEDEINGDHSERTFYALPIEIGRAHV